MSKSGGGGEAKAARRDEERRQKDIREGTEKIDRVFDRQFDDDFFEDRRESFIDFARPQIDRQYGDAGDQLTYALARAGTMDSSMAGDQRADLRLDYDTQVQDAVNKARNYETEARNAVEDARSSLIATLNATGDASGAAKAATNRASALSQTPAYNPISGLFADATVGLAQQAALERAEASSGRDYARYDTPLFGNSRNSVRVGG